MKRNTILTLGALATAAIIGAAALPALAGGPWSGWGPMEGGFGPGMMMRSMHGGWGGRGPAAVLENPMIKSMDANGDGVISPAEAKAGFEALLKKYDSDGDGVLSKQEFGALVADFARGFSDRPFAMLDVDGDGRISAEELGFPAQMIARMQAWRGPAAPAGVAPQQKQ
jgi:hypothetical protein